VRSVVLSLLAAPLSVEYLLPLPLLLSLLMLSL
jgi:hypothetical protein